MAKRKYFPNGFTSWMETHHEIVVFIAGKLSADEDDGMIWKTMEDRGSGGIYELAEDWTDEFEKKQQGKVWENDYFDTLEEFLRIKNTIHPDNR
jgi:hypothetical protein